MASIPPPSRPPPPPPPLPPPPATNHERIARKQAAIHATSHTWKGTWSPEVARRGPLLGFHFFAPLCGRNQPIDDSRIQQYMNNSNERDRRRCESPKGSHPNLCRAYVCSREHAHPYTQLVFQLLKQWIQPSRLKVPNALSGRPPNDATCSSSGIVLIYVSVRPELEHGRQVQLPRPIRCDVSKFRCARSSPLHTLRRTSPKIPKRGEAVAPLANHPEGFCPRGIDVEGVVLVQEVSRTRNDAWFACERQQR